MNPVLILTHNCLELTKKCVESVRNQDIPVWIRIIDNASNDGTKEWLAEQAESRQFLISYWINNEGVSKGWNTGISTSLNPGPFEYGERYPTYPHVLVLNNDVVIPPFFYRILLEANEDFITGRSVEPGSEMFRSCGTENPHSLEKTPHPDFSAFLIRREVWEKVGPFDESMKFYAQDCDYHVRMHRAGIWAGSIPLHFEHHRSSTLNNAPPTEQQEIRAQANRDREAFRVKWGCSVGSQEYGRLFE